METDGPRRAESESEPAPSTPEGPASADAARPGGEGSGADSGGGAVFGASGGWGSGRGGRRADEQWSARKKLAVWGSAGLAAVIVLVAVTAMVIWNHLNGNIRTEGADLKPSAMNGKQDVLFIGSDSRSGGNQTLGGGGAQGARSDTTMIFDSPADRRKGTEVSIPRDSMVQIPACTGTDGQTVPSTFGMFNSAFTSGGAPCTVRAVQSLTGLQLTHYIAVDFEGVVGVVDALGGIKVCVTQPINDRDSGLNIPAGTSTLNGRQALAFVRVRHAVGDGSDLERIQRQQYFIDQLTSQVRADGLLTDPVRLYNVLNAATSAIQTDPGLGSVDELYGLAQTLNSIPSGKMTYVTVPNEAYADDPNRVVWSEPAATRLWDSLINEPDTAAAPQGMRRAGPMPLAPGADLGARAGLGADAGRGAGGPVGERAGAVGRIGAELGGGVSPAANPAGKPASADARAAESLGTFESLMRLALMAETPTDQTAASDTPSGSAGTTTPGGVDVGTCKVS